MDKHSIHRELHVPENEVASRMLYRLRVVDATADNERVLWGYYGLLPQAPPAPVQYAGTEITPTATAAAYEPAVINTTVPAAAAPNQVSHEQQQRVDAARLAIGEAHQQLQEETGHEHLA